jgi:hypothetical protein
MSGFEGDIPGWGFGPEDNPARSSFGFGEGFTDPSSSIDPSAGGGWFSGWNWDKIGAGVKEAKAGLSDISKLNPQQQQQQRLQAAAGQATRGQGFTSIEELLQQLQQRRQALAQLGLQQGAFQPRAPGGNLFGLIRGAR